MLKKNVRIKYPNSKNMTMQSGMLSLDALSRYAALRQCRRYFCCAYLNSIIDTANEMF